jgi:hypothetical protein
METRHLTRRLGRNSLTLSVTALPLRANPTQASRKPANLRITASSITAPLTGHAHDRGQRLVLLGDNRRSVRRWIASGVVAAVRSHLNRTRWLQRESAEPIRKGLWCRSVQRPVKMRSRPSRRRSSPAVISKACRGCGAPSRPDIERAFSGERLSRIISDSEIVSRLWQCDHQHATARLNPRAAFEPKPVATHHNLREIESCGGAAYSEEWWGSA